MRVVVDTNVLISSMLRAESISDKVLTILWQKHLVLTSSAAFLELKRKLPDRKFDKYVNLFTRLSLLTKYEEKTEFVKVLHTVTVCRDPDDNKYLELALSGKADCIITGDSDLQVLNPFENIPIISPKEFLERFHNS